MGSDGSRPPDGPDSHGSVPSRLDGDGGAGGDSLEPRRLEPRRRVIAFSGLLLLSGFCGIAYEILYARILSNFIGDQFAVSASVLLTFLLGIGFGTLFAHRLRPHLWAIEGAVGGCAVLFALGVPRFGVWLYSGRAFHGGIA